MRCFFYIFIFTLLFSCKSKFEREAETVVKEWTGKALVNIPESGYIACSGDTIVPCSISNSGLMIVSYINRRETESCLLHLYDWEVFIQEIDSISNQQVKCALIANPENKYEFIHLLQKYGFKHPVYIDSHDLFNKTNKFHSKMSYHTFLVDKQNHVIFIGNPINSQQVRNSYISIIKGKAVTYGGSIAKTKAAISTNKVVLGHLCLGEVRKANIGIQNIGDNSLVVQDVKTGCGCITVNYDERPINKGDVAQVKIVYHANSTGFFDKAIKIFCNTVDSPYVIHIEGMVDNIP